jgi:hypothetical protein
LSTIKSKFASTLSFGEHAMIAYDNDRERDLLAFQFLQSAVERDDFVVVFAGNTKHFLMLAKKKLGFLKALKSRRMVLLNKKEILEMKDHFDGFSKRLTELISESHKSGRRFSLLGLVPPPTYDRIGLQLGIERILESFDSNPLSTILCIYRKEGLASLNMEDFLLIYNSHDSMLLNTEILRRSEVQ